MSEYQSNQIWMRRGNAGGLWHLFDKETYRGHPHPAKYMKCGAKIGGKTTTFSNTDKRMSKGENNTCPKCLALIGVSK